MLQAGVGADWTVALLLLRYEHLLARLLAVIGGIGRTAKFGRLELLVQLVGVMLLVSALVVCSWPSTTTAGSLMGILALAAHG